MVDFYYPEDIALFEREFVDAEQAAYKETAVEDEEICQRMDDSRRHGAFPRTHAPSSGREIAAAKYFVI